MTSLVWGERHHKIDPVGWMELYLLQCAAPTIWHLCIDIRHPMRSSKPPIFSDWTNIYSFDFLASRASIDIVGRRDSKPLMFCLSSHGHRMRKN